MLSRLACVNAFINMKEVKEPVTDSDPRSQLPFRRKLANQLMAKKMEAVAAVQPEPDMGPDPQPGPSGACNNARPVHTLVKFGPPGRRCKVCKLLNGLRHESRYGCGNCNVTLCQPKSTRNCFDIHRNGRDKI